MNSTNQKRGFTFIELIVTLAIIGILASIVLPLTRITVKRNKEFELQRALREIRKAIDSYKERFDELKREYNTNKRIVEHEELYKKFKVDQVDRSGYPLTLDELVELKLLRRVPRDPMVEGSGEWVLRSYSDDVESRITDEQDVYDIHSSSEETALDGSKYNEW